MVENIVCIVRHHKSVKFTAQRAGIHLCRNRGSHFLRSDLTVEDIIGLVVAGLPYGIRYIDLLSLTIGQSKQHIAVEACYSARIQLHVEANADIAAQAQRITSQVCANLIFKEIAVLALAVFVHMPPEGILQRRVAVGNGIGRLVVAAFIG